MWQITTRNEIYTHFLLLHTFGLMREMELSTVMSLIKTREAFCLAGSEELAWQNRASTGTRKTVTCTKKTSSHIPVRIINKTFLPLPWRIWLERDEWRDLICFLLKLLNAQIVFEVKFLLNDAWKIIISQNTLELFSWFLCHEFPPFNKSRRRKW